MKPGPKPRATKLLANKLELNVKAIYRLGGADRLEAMSPEARNLMLSLATRSSRLVCGQKDQSGNQSKAAE